MSEVRRRMDADAFIAWAMEQPEGARYELCGGEVVGMAPERSGHARLKFRIARRLAEAVEAAGLGCEVFVDGLSVRIDAATVYEPDVMLRCGARLGEDEVEVGDPVVIVEVASPSTRAVDAGSKLADYFRLDSVRHYLIVDGGRRIVIHHARDAAGQILTRIVREGGVRLDPPGVTLDWVFEG